MYQLMIIGGGAAGLAAAATAAAYGVKHIAILERMPRTGKKILATGNGRCNLSHTGITAADYSGSVPTDAVLREFGDASAFFASLGLHCRTDEQGRMYPYTMSAASVLDALRLACEQGGVTELCGQRVLRLYPIPSGWAVETETEQLEAETILFAAGGYAASKLGTDGSAWELLRALHIPLVPPRPVLCPILTDTAMLRPLKGLRVRADVALYDGRNAIAVQKGEVQFTAQALSGICLFNLAGLVDTDRVDDFWISMNLLPELTVKEITALLYEIAAVRYTADARIWLSGIVQKPLAGVILQKAGISSSCPCNLLDGKEIAAVSRLLHEFPFPVRGVGSWEQAQATAGGIAGKALDANLQIKGYSGLYAAGEALDVHSICGGYHLHWAWSSGVYAARRIAERLGYR